MKIDGDALKRMKKLAERESEKARNNPQSGWKNATWDAVSEKQPNGGNPLRKNIQMSSTATKADLMLKLGYDHDTIVQRLQLTQERLDKLIVRYRLPRPY